MVDLDGFKGVNEVLGMPAGDDVLLHAADRIRRVVGPDAIIARLGADEFAAALAVDDLAAMERLGAALVAEVQIRVPMGGRHLHVSSSVGVAVGGGDVPATSVVQDAESALAAAKEGGRNRYVAFEDRHRTASLDREARLALLHQCIDEHTLVVQYQPLVDLETRRIVSLEALARLPDPDGGLVPPALFIPLAEEVGLDARLGALVLEQALEDLARWPTPDGQAPLTMAVNVTARQLTERGYVHQVLSACQRTGTPPERVCLELTETMVMADPEAATRALHELRASGVSAALDDFGVGYSSIAYLKRLPIDILKIDRSFVTGLPHDPDSRAIVGLIVGLAEALGLGVTAEGIEEEEQLAGLLELGCRRGQGYLFDRPVDADTITARLDLEQAGGGGGRR
jgi:diguanylate cyclase (GGDEF)-like protein